MKSPRRECDDDVIAMSNPERIFQYGHEVAAAPGATQLVGKLP